MKIYIPKNENLPINLLASVFNNTTTTYKYYWFISILEIFVEQNNRKISFRDIFIRMICNSWYPIHYFKLNFGIQDKLGQNVIEVQKITNLPIDIPKNELFINLKNTNNKIVNKLINNFNRYVPYRFLSPWFKNKNNNEIMMLSKTFSNNCIYRIITIDNEKYIEINKIWEDYLINNYRILLDFSFWNLSLYLQNKNPNIPNVIDKLIKPVERRNLYNQRKFWIVVFDELKIIRCIYTNKILQKQKFDLDHFIPWSFVSHDLIWNLIPIESSVNLSKRDRLPNLDLYLEKFAFLQKIAIEIIYKKQPNNKLLEDYTVLGGSIYDIIKMSNSVFIDRYYQIMSPLVQIAKNSGFEIWETENL